MLKGRALLLFCSLINCNLGFANFVKLNPNDKLNFHLSTLYLKPSSENLKYAVFVSGNQPFQQSWHNQEIKPGFTPAFELGAGYKFFQTDYDVSIDWLHFNSKDSSSKQASENTDIATVEFVAPPYDVGPAVFGIKRAESKVNFTFNSVLFNAGKTFLIIPNLKTRVFAGINVLDINQKITTVFSDYAGSPLIPSQAYPLPADPSYYFQTKNNSRYLGIGPDIGINIEYQTVNGFGLLGSFLGALTAGSVSSSDHFQSASARLRALGMPTSYQEITSPTTTQLVPGLDSKLGLFYEHFWQNFFKFKIEAGYRFAYYQNAIATIMPQTLVQAGLDASIPEFATGTMAIQSTDYKHSPFSLQGPYLNLTIELI